VGTNPDPLGIRFHFGSTEGSAQGLFRACQKHKADFSKKNPFFIYIDEKHTIENKIKKAKCEAQKLTFGYKLALSPS
jgi:hypothetical protein